MSKDANDKRLIEDDLPIEAISAEASGEPRTKGHISTLHIWRARRPLVACRAAVFGALVPADRFVPENATDGKKRSLGRANAARFVKELCRYPGSPRAIQEAQRLILSSRADGAAPRVLDLFAGGGAEALHRLLWLVEKKPPLIPEFLNEAKPNLEQLRLVAQALAGPALKGGELATVSPTAEQSALGKLLANWNSVMVGKAATADKRAGQQQLEI